MQNCKLLFEKNRTNVFDSKIKKRLKLNMQNKHLEYNMNVGTIFNGDHIWEIIALVNYVRKKYRQKIPIEIYLGKFEFYDKLVYIILESIIYYLNKIYKHKVRVHFYATHNIWTEGIKYSPLVKENRLTDRYLFDISKYHFRKCILKRYKGREEYLCDLFQDVYSFLFNNGIDETTCEKLSEVIIELVGNAGEHGDADCVLDIDITQSEYTKSDDNGIFYGVNVAILNYSQTLFFEPLKNKFASDIELSSRYKDVMRAKEYHLENLHENYSEDDFYTISSFQHKISGSKKKNELGGTGLTSLLRSLEEDSDTHICYMLSGNRVIFFEKENMLYDSDGYVSFNEDKSFFSEIPSKRVFSSINTFLPGVAYNLNYAVKKESFYE